MQFLVTFGGPMIAVLVLAACFMLFLIFSGSRRKSYGKYVGRMPTFDSASAFQFRMGAGQPGDVNRTRAVSIEPFLINAANPPLIFGQPLIPDAANGLRPFAAGDTAVTVAYGAMVRAYPTQARAGGDSAAFGAAVPPTSGPADTLRAGYIMVQIATAFGTIKKGDPVFVWCAAASGAHVQGGYETAASGGNTAALDPNRFSFNGPADASGVAEISFNL